MKTIMKSFQIVCFSVLLAYAAQALPNGSPITDTAITTQIKASLLKDYSNINVTTDNGVVVLSGNVNAESDADIVIEKVESVDGVKNIDTTELYINGSQQIMPDTVISAKAKVQLLREKLMNVKVETTNGIVYLSGSVKNKKELNKAVSLVQAIDGVTSVNKTQLKVSQK